MHACMLASPMTHSPVFCLLQDDVASCFEYYADLAEKLDKRQGQALELPMEEFKGAIQRESLGVVGLITPWNYPMLMAAVSAIVLTCLCLQPLCHECSCRSGPALYANLNSEHSQSEGT